MLLSLASFVCKLLASVFLALAVWVFYDFLYDQCNLGENRRLMPSGELVFAVVYGMSQAIFHTNLARGFVAALGVYLGNLFLTRADRRRSAWNKH